MRRLFSTVRTAIQADLLAALKAKDAPRATLLRQLLAELTHWDKSSPQAAPSDAAHTAVVHGCAGRWAKAIAEYRQLAEANPGRSADIQRVLEKEAGELAVIRSYLPAPHSDAELAQAVERAVRSLAARSAAPSISAVIAEAGSSIDWTRASRKDVVAHIQKRLAA